MADTPLIAFVQFEPDGRSRMAGAFRLTSWPWSWGENPADAVEDARIRLASRGGHYPVMAASPAMGKAAIPLVEIDDQFQPLSDLPPSVGDASLKTTYDLARHIPPPGLPKPQGQFCARVGCQHSASFDKPLCYSHWREWEANGLEECTRCRWVLGVDEASFWSHLEEEGGVTYHCDPCLPSALTPDRWPIHNVSHPGQLPVTLAHAPLVRPVRYVYILKLDGGDMYVGQTPNLPVRIREHRDGLVMSTKGKNSKLVYFEVLKGDKSGVADREDELTALNQSPLGRRRLREMIEDFRSPLRLVDLEA